MENSSPKTTLKEGRSYPFKVTGSVMLPDGSECFILTDVNRIKHLLFKEYYKKYNLQLNQEITCRIDKINCTGKIFIEPEHPYYKLGKSYTFVFDHYINLPITDQVSEKMAVLMNGYDQDIFLSADELENPFMKGDEITAVVEKIKKGRVYINIGSAVNDYGGMEAGKQYRFTLSGQITMGGRYSYYVLKDSKGKQFRIRKKFYEKYGFKDGDLITCELVEDDYHIYLEPVHPYFEVGFNYEFRIVGETTIKEYPDGQAEAYLLENSYGKEIVVKKKEVPPENIRDGIIRCTVSFIKKSQVSLAC